MHTSQPASYCRPDQTRPVLSGTQTLLAGPLALGSIDEAHAVQGPFPKKSIDAQWAANTAAGNQELGAGSWELGAAGCRM